MKALKITAMLDSPLCGDAPMLDGLLTEIVGRRSSTINRISRSDACPDLNSIPTPIAYAMIGGMNISLASSPILGVTHCESVEYVNKRLGGERAEMLAVAERKVIAHGTGALKSQRLPSRIRVIDRVVWFCVAKSNLESPLSNFRRLLRKDVHAIGQDRSMGYGRVAEWVVEYAEHDYSWYAPCGKDVVLMRPLPVCDELPSNLIGARRAFAACAPPYWHPDRNCEVVVPC